MKTELQKTISELTSLTVLRILNGAPEDEMEKESLATIEHAGLLLSGIREGTC